MKGSYSVGRRSAVAQIGMQTAADLRAEMQRQGVSVPELARRVEQTPGGIYHVVGCSGRGPRTLAVLYQLADALGCDVEIRIVRRPEAGHDGDEFVAGEGDCP